MPMSSKQFQSKKHPKMLRGHQGGFFFFFGKYVTSLYAPLVWQWSQSCNSPMDTIYGQSLSNCGISQ